MGNTLIHSSRSDLKKKKKKRNTKREFYQELNSSSGGTELLACSFGAWCREQRHVCGFSDEADYTSSRSSVLQMNSPPNRPDTTEGRFFRSGFKTRSELLVYEKETLINISVKLPRVTSMEMSTYLRNNRPRRKRRSHRCARVLAYGNGYIVVQMTKERLIPFTKFYIIHLEKQVCCGHFVVANTLRRWYEVHISPSGTHIVIRPEVRYHFQAAITYEVQNVRFYPPMSELTVKKIPYYLPNFSLAYNRHLGDKYVVAGSQGFLQVYRTADWQVISSHAMMDPYARIHQIRSSPTGDYIAVRATFPTYRYHTNNIIIYRCPCFTRVLWVDVQGSYWPLSELINLQVFPRFSLSETCLAIMNQRNCGRKVYVYKLPVEMRSLQDLCRRAILHLVSWHQISKLPVPEVVQKYLTYTKV